MKKTGIYRLAGLSKPKSATLTYGKNEEFFWAAITMPPDRVHALWDYCKGNWDEPKYAVIRYDDLAEDGCPINAELIDIRL